MWIILLGAPGAGKGTQAERICKRFNLFKISTGDMLRAEITAQTTLGSELKEKLANGQLISDDIVISLVKKQIATVQAAGDKSGFLFDGFPRTLHQSKVLESFGIPVDYVLYIQVDDEQIVKRLSGRRVHLSSGRTYHIDFHPADTDELTGEPLVQREDDREEIVRKRLQIYHQQTEPLIQWYENHSCHFLRISGAGSIEEVWQRIELAFDATTEKR